MKRTLRISSILFALALVLGFSLVAVIPARADVTANHYVSAAGSNTAPYDTWAKAAHKIQDAVDAAGTGDTVYVADGTYYATNETSIVITKNSTSLVGQSRDGTIIDAGTWGTSSVVSPRGIQVYAYNVTIKNFTVQGFVGDGTSTNGYGIVFRDWAHDTQAEGYIFYSGGVVDNVKLQNNGEGMYALVNINLTVRNSLIQNSLYDGIFIARESDNAVITGNTVKNSGDQGIWVGYDWSAVGPSDNATITDNCVDGVREGGISFVHSNGATISGNIITNVAGAGWSVGALSLKDGCSNVQAYDNTIYNNSGAWGGYGGTGNGVGIDGTPSNISLHNNNIYSNTGYGLRNYSTVVANATSNWWGHASGPGGMGPGSGDEVSNYVAFSPWLTAPYIPQMGVATSTGTGTASFSPDNGNIAELAARSVPTGSPANVVFPHGMFSFRVCCITGPTVTLNITLPGPVPVGSRWYKHQGGSWSSLPIGSDDGDSFITVTLHDGVFGEDEDSYAGQITDDGGPGNPGPVGWETHPINKARVLQPWITLIATVMASVGLLVAKRRRAQS